MNPVAVLRRHFANVERSRQMLEEIREGVANLTDVTNRHMVKLVDMLERAAAEAASTGVERQQRQLASRSISVGSVRLRAPFPVARNTVSNDH
jgi:hypothetical protein